MRNLRSSLEPLPALLRGEVQIRVSEFRVRGEARCLPQTLSILTRMEPLTPTLSPQERDEGAARIGEEAGLPGVAFPLEIVGARHQSGDGGNHAVKPPPALKPPA